MSRTDTRQALENVLRNPAIWRAEQTHARYPGISTAHPALDQALPDGGWPVGVLTELLVKETGAGELTLLLPALRAICAEQHSIALLAPPYLPHARAWQGCGIALERMLVVNSEGVDLMWATEQILRSGECGAVLVWGQAAGRALNHRALQRLHLAASAGNALCFLYRPISAQEAPSPAPLRIRLVAHAGALHVHLVKCRGAMRSKPIRVELFPSHWQPLPVQILPATPQTTVAIYVKTSRVPGPPHQNETAEAASASTRIPAAAYCKPADVQIASEPAFVAAASQWNAADGATNAPDFSSHDDATLFQAVNSRTSVV